jgi:hypothetical protein
MKLLPIRSNYQKDFFCIVNCNVYCTILIPLNSLTLSSNPKTYSNTVRAYAIKLRI